MVEAVNKVLWIEMVFYPHHSGLSQDHECNVSSKLSQE